MDSGKLTGLPVRADRYTPPRRSNPKERPALTSYSPFDKPLADLASGDLAVLRAVPESWHVEYKLVIDDTKTLTKALGAFANTYGGWLIVGVEESEGAEKTAQNFPGLSAEELSLLLQRLSSSIDGNLRPVPHFEHRVVSGPCEEVGLSEGQSVVVVHVPMSVHTPHLQTDGRVYQRVGDTSQPIKERRHLDELWQRADSVRQATKLWIDDDPEFSKGEGKAPYLRLLFVPDPWNKGYQLPPMSPRRFQETLNQPGLGMSIPFDSVFSTNNGYIARHIFSNNPRHLGLTLTVRRDFSCDIIMPFNVFNGVKDQLLQSLASKYENAESYVKLLVNKGYWREDEWMDLDVVDLNPLLYRLIAITNQYRALLRLVTSDSDFHFKARVLQAWRRLPFLDVPQVIESFTHYGVPMPMSDELTIPPGTDPDTFAPLQIEANSSAEPDDELWQRMDQAIPILFRVFTAFGVSGLLNDDGEIVEGVAHSLVQAAQRSTPINVV